MQDYDIYGGHFRLKDDGGSLCLTGADWSAGRRATGRCYGYRWVDPSRENRTKEEWPYSYSDHYLLGEQKEGDHAVYSDRLQQWSAEKWNRAWAAVKGNGGFRGMSQKTADKFMSDYEGKPMTVTAIAEGCNVSSGYPYWVIWFHEAK